jgi:hypothetical protein
MNEENENGKMPHELLDNCTVLFQVVCRLTAVSEVKLNENRETSV